MSEPDISDELPEGRPDGEPGYRYLPRRSFPFGLVVFVLGFVCGIPIAMFAPSMVADYGQLVITVILSVLFALALILSMVFALRDRIWRWLFRRSEIELSRFAGPLSDVAKSAAEGKVDAATDAARTFAEIALARYAWVSTRRWLIGSITGLIASIAALAGSALLFEQNRLLRAQSTLLAEQNTRIDDQTELLRAQARLSDTQTQLAEAERSAQVGPEVIEIGALIGAERQAYLEAGNDIDDFGLDDLTTSVRSRIVAATLVARPYLYLRPRQANPLDNNALAMKALSRRQDALISPEMLADFDADNVTTELIDSPLSPERGDLLSMLVDNSILDTERLSFVGADFSFAEIRREVMPGLSMRHARLSFADFTLVRVVRCRFGGAKLEHAVFDQAVVRGSDFSSIEAAEVEPPFSGEGVDLIPTFMTGAMFTGAIVIDTAFRRIQAIAPSFSGSVVARADFTGAGLNAAEFRNAIIIDSTFAGAELRSIDLEGAIVFDLGFVQMLSQAAVPGTFVAERWSLEPLSAAELAEHPRYDAMTIYLPEAAYAGRQAFRIVRNEGQ
ncbi:MAG: pentapeptide repeat-containing protein [Phyllobacteriaceae bacterium]|nr:pentapeptide repeat-containing protein [Phyllobacteriaceae bacterium]